MEQGFKKEKQSVIDTQTVSGTLYNKDQSSKVIQDLENLAELLNPERGKMFGKEFVKNQRQTLAFYLGDPIRYRYSSKTRDHIEAPEFVRGMAKKIEQIMKTNGINQEFNTGIFTKYFPPSEKDKNDRGDLNWHDDQHNSNLVKNSVVASVVFGEQRRVFLRLKSDHKKQQCISPGNGSFYYMIPGCQELWQHRVERGKGIRYSFTFRTVNN